MEINKCLLVGDNPFHGVSHFSQEKARNRDNQIQNPAWAASLVDTCYENGSNGFMFSVSETTLSIIRLIKKTTYDKKYYAIVPAAGDYVRLSSQVGTIGLVRYVAKQTLKSGNVDALLFGAKGVVTRDLPSLFKAYIAYELSRIKQSLAHKGRLHCLMLHELVTEMAIAMNMEWLIRVHIQYAQRVGIKPGFETRNFASLVGKLRELEIDTSNLVITAPFNNLGFQMNPNKTDCEKALSLVAGAEVIAMSVLAAGRLELPVAHDYISSLPGISGLVVGISSQQQAEETFKYFRDKK